ncbi:hypothetical protein RsoM2USA_470 [Ralstonia phage RsoM2USA]|nr:hypothetical protein RsoM2USA_470 [Ralstonia phage RsoM2USA]
MIHTVYGNMVEAIAENDLYGRREFYVHGCNAQGAMGRGIAGEFRREYPTVWKDYRRAYLLQGLKVGDVISVELSDSWGIVFNAITQEFYGADKNVVYVDYDGLRKCFKKINKMILNWNTEFPEVVYDKVLNFPLIGAGLANGDWNIIEKIIDDEIDNSIEKVLWKLP